VNYEVRDLWIDGGQVIAPPADLAARGGRTIDARGYVVMPGGVGVEQAYEDHDRDVSSISRSDT
jgi:formylmethanofuran dehydrogenase subunit A